MSLRHRRARTPRLLAIVLLGAVLGSGLTGCAVLKSELDRSGEHTVDYGDVVDAVSAAVPRVATVEDPSRSLNGFEYRIGLRLVTDSAEPFTADDLDAVAEAVWTSLPWEPGTIRLTAVAETAQGLESVDLRTAASALEPLTVRQAGQGGVSLTGMSARYGAWTPPN